MADKLLKSVTFPDLTDKYIVADPTLSVSGAGADAKATGDALATKADVAGTDSELTSGTAETILSDSTTENITPYSFRKTPVNADREYLDKVVGGSVAFNQLVNPSSIGATTTVSGLTFTNNGDGTVTVNGTSTELAEFAVVPQKTWNAHKYFVFGCPAGGNENYNLNMKGQGANAIDRGNGVLWDASGNTWKGMSILVASGVTINNLVFKPNIIDLTQMFGSTVADAIYAMETATAGSGVAYLKSVAPKMFSQYNAYDAGSIKSVEATAHKTVGFNQFDKSTATAGKYIKDDGSFANDADSAYTDYIKVVPNVAYYLNKTSWTNPAVCFYDADKNFISGEKYNGATSKTVTAPANAMYMRASFAVANIDTFCVNISDTNRNGTYEPYNGHSYPLADLTLRGIPKWDSGLYYDGDEYYADGTVVRKYGVVDLGSLTWGKDQTYTQCFSARLDDAKSPANVCQPAVCSKYECVYGHDIPLSEIAGSDKKAFLSPLRWSSATKYIVISDSSYSDATAFKASLNGVYLVYELATPATESADPFTNVQICDGDGTEEFISDSIVPTGHSTRYPKDLKSVLEDIADAPSTNGTYILKATVSSSGTTYEWVAE